MEGFLAFSLIALSMWNCKLGDAAPSIESCPADSALVDDACVCRADACTKPPCLTELRLVTEGTNEPGSCCNTYSCEGCRNESRIEGKCPCAVGAVLNDRGACECANEQMHPVNGTCECDPLRCKLPIVCDRKSVLVTSEDGCCTNYECAECPEDSEATDLGAIDGGELEDHCVCLPCSTECGANKRPVVIRRGTGFPGRCCDLYECKPIDANKESDCVVGDIIYENNEQWSTEDKQQCTCKNGISLCTPKNEGEEAPLQNCWDEAVTYKHNETWLKDLGCTFCTCLNGEIKCISHYCDVKESQINNNRSQSCTTRDQKRVVAHLQTWIEEDDCTECKCMNGETTCDSSICHEKEKDLLSSSNKPPGECQSPFVCNKRCAYGFRINKRGCEICKCNPPNVNPEWLAQFNITYPELVSILVARGRSGNDADISVTTTTASPSTSSIFTTSTLAQAPSVGDINDDQGDTVITPAFQKNADWWIAVPIVVLVIGIGLGIVGYCIFKNKRKYSVSSARRGTYHCVENPATDNNNTIKKTITRIDCD